MFSANTTVCVPPGLCTSPSDPALGGALARWWGGERSQPVARPLARCGAPGCAASELAAAQGLRPCSRSAERQEAFLAALATALGLGRGGFFLELGGHNGVHASNTVFSEACRGWRGALIEANPASFRKMVEARPSALGVRGAVCAARGVATFASRRSKGAWRKGSTAPTADETGGIESLMGHTFEKAGYVNSAPTAWLKQPMAVRFEVPCAPLADYLRLLRVKRVDIFWLDVEGAEATVLQTLPPAAEVSIGLLVVEMRYNDVANSRRIGAMLAEAGFELTRTLAVWNDKIVDMVYLRAAHFMPPGASAATWRLPAAVPRLLNSLPSDRPKGANLRYRRGRVGSAQRYVVDTPLSLESCAVWVAPGERGYYSAYGRKNGTRMASVAQPAAGPVAC